MSLSSAVQNLDYDRLATALDERWPMATSILSELRDRTADGDGVTRPSYGKGEQIGHDLMRVTASAVGLEVTTDAAGNLYATLPGADRGAPGWISGSHFDSVPSGGNYDGAAGAVAALVAIATIKDLGIRTALDMTAMAIRSEESSSWFSGRHGGHLGSRAALGLLQPSELDTALHLGTGATLAQSIDNAGFNSAAVRSRPPHLTAANVRGFIELHIEQGPVLVGADAPVGIVTGIRGTIRLRDARCIGAYSHSGAVPQELRQDAVLATAELINRIERHCADLRARGKDIVFAVGRLHTDAAVDSLSKVPGLVSFTVDLRSQEPEVLETLNTFIDVLADEISTQRKIRFEFRAKAVADPTVMDSEFRTTLRTAAKHLRLKAPELACGAGHDAAEFVRARIPSCMIFVRNTGESHNPEEHMDSADFRQGTLLLTCFLAAAAQHT